MGLLDRLKAPRVAPPAARPSSSPRNPTTVTAHLHSGDEDLEIVGESHYQDALWTICGRSLGDEVRHRVVAVLVPEPSNPHDSNAISIQIDASVVGYFPREVAAQYIGGLQRLMDGCGGYVALEGVIVGGGYRSDGPGKLGVWLEHDPSDFGLTPSPRTPWAGPGTRPTPAGASMRTGFTEAWLTDVEDDSYDLSWFNELPDADRPAIAMLRELLASDPDPIDRHYQFAELEDRLYGCRDLYEEAIDEFDEACQLHDAEMSTICAAFHAKWGKVPLLETYRQMAIRQQKKRRRTGPRASGGRNVASSSMETQLPVRTLWRISSSVATAPGRSSRRR